ncbi:MAG: hypothetical protein U0930_03230 [Pirellulales bacterium]
MASFDPFGSEDELKLQPLDEEQGLPTGLPDFDFGTEQSVSFDEDLTGGDPWTAIEAEPVLANASAGPVAIAAIADEAGVVANLVPPTPAEPLSDQEIERRRQWRRIMFGTAPSWAISLVLHVILIVSLALVTLDPVDKVLSILQGGSETESTRLRISVEWASGTGCSTASRRTADAGVQRVAESGYVCNSRTHIAKSSIYLTEPN